MGGPTSDGGPNFAPQAPHVRSTPGDPGRSSISRGFLPRYRRLIWGGVGSVAVGAPWVVAAVAPGQQRYVVHVLIFTMLFAALAQGPSRYLIPRHTDHLESNLWLAEQFGARVQAHARQVIIEGVGFQQ